MTRKLAASLLAFLASASLLSACDYEREEEDVPGVNQEDTGFDLYEDQDN